jgi:hypothetical protein
MGESNGERQQWESTETGERAANGRARAYAAADSGERGANWRNSGQWLMFRMSKMSTRTDMIVCGDQYGLD